VVALEDVGIQAVEVSADDVASTYVKEGFNLKSETADLSIGKTPDVAKLFWTGL
jgi:hypothetical protein